MSGRLTRMRQTAGRVLAHKGALLSLLFLALMILTALFARWILPYDALTQDYVNMLQPPGSAHWFGTDELGRDIFARVIYGARTSLLTAAGAVTIAGLIGVPIGLMAGFFGAWRVKLLIGFCHVLLSLHGIPFPIAPV